MTEEQKQMIVRLRNVGIGYRKIAAVLDIHGIKSEIISNP